MTRLSRRQALFRGLTLAAVAASAPKTALAEPADPLAPINERLDALERWHNAIVGVHAVDIETGRNVGHRDAELFAVYSTFKTYAAAAVLQKSDELSGRPCRDKRTCHPRRSGGPGAAAAA